MTIKEPPLKGEVPEGRRGFNYYRVKWRKYLAGVHKAAPFGGFGRSPTKLTNVNFKRAWDGFDF